MTLTSNNLRNRIGFLLLGLTNNYGYVIMLTAAYDLLSPAQVAPSPQPKDPNQPQPYCNKHGTATILLADALPSLPVKLIYPFLLVDMPLALLTLTCVASTVASYLMVAFARAETLIYIGVCFASISSGMGESTFLSYTPQFEEPALGGWSMGTGVAGIVGALAYTLLSETAALETKTIMLIMIVAPATMALAYFVIVKPDFPDKKQQRQQQIDEAASTIGDSDQCCKVQLLQAPQLLLRPAIAAADNDSQSNNIESMPLQQASEQDLLAAQLVPLSFGEKIAQLPGLAKYFMPLLFVYAAEYFINQGLFELIYFADKTPLDKKAQYKWFSVTYQLGVFVSRSSVEFVRIHNLWLMAGLQTINLVVFLLHTLKVISLPSFEFVIALIFYEGLLGGLAYVNTFSRVRAEVDTRSQEYAITTVTISDTLGIVLASLAAMPSHDYICDNYYS